VTNKEVNMKTLVRIEKLPPGFKTVRQALLSLMLVAVGYAQEVSPTDAQPGAQSSASPTSGTSSLKPILPTGSGRNTQTPTPFLSPGSYSTYCTYRTWGAGPFYCWDPGINANSRVFAAVSEYSTDPQHRFLGNAWMTIHNIIPNNGYVTVVVDTGWTAFPINIRLDLLVDP
jgi:hypothetical protein